jgi:rod shape-determining protein MreB
LFSLFSSDLAIDLGTANTCVYARGKGIVVNEPSIVAINKVTGRIEAVGKEAKEMLGRTPGNIVAIKPMKDGVIATSKSPRRCSRTSSRRRTTARCGCGPRLSSACRRRFTQVEKRAVKDSAYRAKASEVYLVEEAMAAAIGAGMPIEEASGNMVVDIGGGTTDIAVISLAASSTARRFAWRAMRWMRRSSSSSRSSTTCSSASARPKASRWRSARRIRWKSR